MSHVSSNIWPPSLRSLRRKIKMKPIFTTPHFIHLFPYRLVDYYYCHPFYSIRPFSELYSNVDCDRFCAVDCCPNSVLLCYRSDSLYLCWPVFPPRISFRFWKIGVQKYCHQLRRVTTECVWPEFPESQ